MKNFLLLLIIVAGFPIVSLSQEITDAEKLKGYKSSLEKFSESPFVRPENSDIEFYRLLVWPTFHSPVLITLERNKVAAISSKTLEGEGGHKVGKINKQLRRILSVREFKKFNVLLNSDFDDLPNRDTRFDKRPDGDVEICLDGANWYFESSTKNGYRLIERYCPEYKALLKVGFLLVKMSKLGIKQRELF